MSTVTITGKVSAQSAAGETITISITGPNPQSLTATTAADGSFSNTYTETTAGSYNAAISVAADATYTSASVTVPFVVTVLQARTITASVTVVTA